MSVYAGPEITNDGLILHLDASNKKSYPGSGTTWTDMSGNGRNCTLASGPTFDANNNGSIVFDGVDDYANHSTALITSPTAITSIIWFKPTSDGVILAILGQSNINSSYHHSSIEIASTGVVSMSLWHGALTNRVNSSALSFNLWYQFAYTMSGTTFNSYINGTFVGSTTLSWSSPSSLHVGICAADSTAMGTTAYGHGQVSSLAMYNRALSAAEVRQNFNALRGRFGI